MSKPIEFQDHPWSVSKNPPTYRAVCKRVKDGDTFEMFIDLGLRKYAYEEIRLRGVDTPELFHPRNEAEKIHATAAAEFVRTLIEGRQVIIRTYSDTQTYGRFVAEVSFYSLALRGWKNLGSEIVAAGYAKRESY